MQGEKYPYQKEWEEYRRLRNGWIVSFPLGILGAIIIGIVLDYLFGEQLWGGYLAFCVYGFVYLKAVIRFNNWRCPRCNDRFYSPSFWASSPADITNCRNCNLLKYSGSSFID